MLVASTATEIVVPIVTAVLGGLAGIGTTWYTTRQHRLAERRSHLREVATEFAERLGGAANAVRYVIEARERGSTEQKPFDDAQHYVGELSPAVARVRIRLGAKAGSAAKLAVEDLRRALEAIGSPDQARAAYERATRAEDDFVRSARADLGEKG